ncbi:MAG: acyl--CoA ligase [Deltaproteobacteria bacterium]|nr:acyl--CoA ligase [Deltaproteobacteria bacterium]
MLIDRLLTHSAERRPSAVAFIQGEKRATYGELHDMASRMSRALRDLGVRRGDRVAIALENSIEYLAAHFGVLMTGGVSVPVYHGLPPASFNRIAADCKPFAVISRPPFFRSLLKSPVVAGGAKHIIAGPVSDEEKAGGALSFADCLSSPLSADREAGTHDDLATIIYTSGTTGDPKGVMLSHRNLAANTSSIVSYLGLTAEDSVMVVLPFYYSYGNSVLLSHVMQGATLVADNRFMYPNKVLEAIAAEKVTGFAGVPSTFAIMCHRSSFRNMSFPALRYMTQAGGAMPHEMAFELMKVVPHAKIYIMYGQTEASARLSYLPPEDIYKKAGSVGKAIPGVKLEVLGEDGQPVKPGETGEIIASGENIMMGYWGRPAETEAVLKDGRLRTGDMATVDEDGYIYIMSRKTDMIKSGAHRIAPREIEEALLKDPDVFEAAVVGRPDSILGESICAFVVLKDNQISSADTLLRVCREHLPAYKIPKKIFFMKSLPKTENMKVKKSELKKILQTNAEV